MVFESDDIKVLIWLFLVQIFDFKMAGIFDHVTNNYDKATSSRNLKIFTIRTVNNVGNGIWQYFLLDILIWALLFTLMFRY